MTNNGLKLFVAVCAAAMSTVSTPVLGYADETVVVDGIQNPEGPLWIDGTLYFVGAVDSKLYKWDGKNLSVLNADKDCAHNGLAATSHGSLLVACSSLQYPGIIEVDLEGKVLHHWQGKEFEGGVNDIVVAKNGGIFATICGPAETPPHEVAGRIIYSAPGSDDWRTVARDLDYANGIGLSPDQKTLYVSETIGNDIKKFNVEPDGTLTHRSNFALLNLLVKNKAETWWIGPDSMKIDDKGDMYVAQFSGGKILKISPEGKLLHVFDVAAGDGTTNVAFDAGEKNLYIAVGHDPNDPQLKGGIVKVPNE